MAEVLVEFLDEDNLENTISLFHGRYDRVMYFYAAEKAPSEEARLKLKRFLKQFWGLESLFIAVEEMTIPGIREAFEANLNETDRYAFDITGGCELFIAAIGFLLRGYTGDRFCLQQYDVRNDCLLYRYPSRQEEELRRKELSVRNYLALIGTSEIPEAEGEDADLRSKEVRSEVLRMWNATKDLPEEWNRFCTLSEYKLSAEEVKQGFRALRLTSDKDRIACERIAAELRRQKLLESGSVRQFDQVSCFCYRLKSKLMLHELYVKAGTTLEMLVCLAAVEGAVFSDARTGVVADLNGIVTGRPGDPRNEIDVIAVCRNKAAFISCKNTRPTKEFLYEIMTVTREYGGKYAVPMLVSTVSAFSTVKNRAKEMGVILIDDAAKLSFAELRTKLAEPFGMQKAVLETGCIE